MNEAWGDDYKEFLKESTPSTIEGCIRQSMDLKLTKQDNIPYQELVYVLSLAQERVNGMMEAYAVNQKESLYKDMEDSINVVRDYFFPEKTEDE